ncbi:MAG: AAA family ATPase, partial [Gemmatimonadales bacterium]
REIAAEATSEIVICDRSVLDNYAYLVHQAGRQPGYDALVREWVGSYTGLFKVPITAAPSFDGKRDVNEGFQHDIDAVIDELAHDLGVPCHLLDRDRRDGWVDEVLLASGLPLHPPQIDLFPRPDEAA